MKKLKPKNPAKVRAGQLGGLKRSKRKILSAIRNGLLGGRPISNFKKKFEGVK